MSHFIRLSYSFKQQNDKLTKKDGAVLKQLTKISIESDTFDFTMCAGAIIHARIANVVYGAPDPRTGSAGSAIDVFAGDYHNHFVEVEGGVMKDECGQILKDLFKERRNKTS